MSNQSIKVVNTYSGQEPEAVALQNSFVENRNIASDIAKSLRMRLLGVKSKSHTFDRDDQQKRTGLTTTVEYITTPFNPVRFNLSFWRMMNWSLVKKAIKSATFKRYFPLRSRSKPVQHDAEKTLVAGHFSFPGGGGTFGDIEAMRVVASWLDEAGIPYDIAANKEDGINGRSILRLNPAAYRRFLFVCGPWYGKRGLHGALLKQFQHTRKIGVNVTTLGEPGLDQLYARDTIDESHADLAFAAPIQKLPVMGVLLVDRQNAYGSRQRHRYIRTIIEAYLAENQVAPVWLDTNASNNSMGIRTAEQFESIIGRLDVIVTNRLHGLVLGLKNDIPVIACDPIAGGGKITKQAKVLDWPLLIPANAFNPTKLREMIAYCQENDLSERVKRAQERASVSNEQMKQRFLDEI